MTLWRVSFNDNYDCRTQDLPTMSLAQLASTLISSNYAQFSSHLTRSHIPPDRPQSAPQFVHTPSGAPRSWFFGYDANPSQEEGNGKKKKRYLARAQHLERPLQNNG
jgi:hypothetical protein